MGRIRVLYDETSRKMKQLGWWGRLNVDGCRTAMSGKFRYCLHDDVFFMPKDTSVLEQAPRLCWGTLREEEVEQFPWLTDFDSPVPLDPLALSLPFSSLAFSVRYSRRHRETSLGRIAVNEFVAQELIDAIDTDPHALVGVGKEDFEALVAELYARQGFEVDLFRKSQDDGIDFLAVRNEDTPEPIILAVQAKHPDPAKAGRKRKVLGVPVIREVFGVAKAWDLAGAIAVTSSTYSKAAKRFTERKPEQMSVVDGKQVLEWVRKYRWEADE